jgi:signal transduction histidine kinase
LTGIATTDSDQKLGKLIHEAQEELRSLRHEVARYKLAFDSARMLIGHEYIKPLTAISGYVELLESELDGSIGEKEQHYLLKVKGAISRLDELIESTVQMLQTGGKVERIYSVENVDLGKMMDALRERLGEVAGRIECDIPAELDSVLIRRRGFEVVVENLISNALKHSGSTKIVNVSFSVIEERRSGSEGKLLMVKVEDRGEGIPEDELKRVFDRFYRGSKAKDGKGFGLGLALVKSIVTIMNGEINIDSEVGKGTRVTVTVPVINGAHEAPETIG